MNIVYLDEFREYASRWGITDFYPEVEAKLKELIASHEDFECDWFGCKKEIHYARYRCENGKFTVEVSVHCDSLWDEPDLIYDALDDISIEVDELSDEDIDYIRSIAIEDQIDDCVKLESVIDTPVTFNDIVKETDRLENEAAKQLHSKYEELCMIVKEYFEYKGST